MGLKHLKIPTASIETAGGDLTVRGLNLPDITSVVLDNKAVLNALFTEIAARENGVSINDTSVLVSLLAERAPGTMVRIIAIAADEDNAEGLHIASTLPFTVQIEALEAIGKLTFATQGSPKKVLETVIRIARGVMEAMTALQLSKDGSGS